MAIQARNLLLSGAVLFLLGLMVGGTVQMFENPRMGLSSHLAAMQNALALFAFGLMYKYLNLSAKALSTFYYSSIYAMYSVWLALTLAAMWGTSRATPIAGKGFTGTATQENIVDILIYSGAGATFLAAILLIIGLWRHNSN